MKRILTCLLFALPVCLPAQKVSDELKKVREAYLKAAYFSADVEVNGYPDKASSKIVAIGSGTMRKHGSSYYSKFGTDEMISNGNCTVIIDHYEKSVMWFDSGELPKKK